jgi:hypothetical protein
VVQRQQQTDTSAKAYRRQSDRGYLFLVIAGGGLIALLFGLEGLVTALPFLLGGVVLILLPWWTLTALQRWRDRMEQAERDALDSDSS